VQPLRDLDQVRTFLSSQGPTALFDFPWMPIYLAICFAFHLWIGVAALVGAIIMIVLTMTTEVLARGPIKAATVSAVLRNAHAETSRRNAELLVALGMTGQMRDRWSAANSQYMASQQAASDVTGGLSAVSKTFRMMLQSGVLGIGAYLVIHQEATGGIIIASSILTARALAPIDLAIANWRGFVAARQGWDRLNKLLALLPALDAPMALPAPTTSIVVEMASAAPPGEQRLVVQDVNFTLKSGSGLGIVGPSASGKSSLARMLVGVWELARGRICIDGAALTQWSPEMLGRHLGYLPQDVELLAGTVAQNISRFEPNAPPAAIIAAAKAAGVHELVLNLSGGYEANVGEQGRALSAGQQQRIALARALYRDPFLVVLDEPNSNLDGEGEKALTKAILGVRARGGIVIVVAHNPSAVAGVDFLLIMGQGRQQTFGPKEEIFHKLMRPAPASPVTAFPEVLKKA
jgi:ATP-binding cassette subfamily C protein